MLCGDVNIWKPYFGKYFAFGASEQPNDRGTSLGSDSRTDTVNLRTPDRMNASTSF